MLCIAQFVDKIKLVDHIYCPSLVNLQSSHILFKPPPLLIKSKIKPNLNLLKLWACP